ncbi:aminotransferase class V-fold PLP-dependent enzyme, partial [bacterium]|nr:aminotransferase class V-fold PLP-dependent enzyme [bacterium]
MGLIYLDNNATTKVDERVLEAMLPYFKEEYANPSSIYDFAKISNRAVKDARATMKDFFNAENEKEIIFTSCGSESANTAIRGVLNMNKNKRHIITTKVEHPCVLNLYMALEKEGYKVDYIGVNSNGELDLAQLEDSICDDTALVSVMYANNETGVINPIEKISQIIKSKNKETKFFVDAVQVTGKIPIDVQKLGVDLMGIS